MLMQLKWSCTVLAELFGSMWTAEGCQGAGVSEEVEQGWMGWLVG